MKLHIKQILVIGISLLLLAGLFPEPIRALTAPQNGINLDCARRYYSVEEIKKYIRLLSGQEHSFLQLHLTDDENVGVECRALGQTVKKAKRLSGGRWKNRKTGKLFLSRTQIRSILSYAQKKGVAVIPEISGPAHMGGFFTLAKQDRGKKFARKVFMNQNRYPGELDISEKRAIRFAKSLYREYAALFSGCARFHIGGDEYFSHTPKQQAAYINAISRYMERRGFTVRVYNDLFRKKNIKQFNPNLEIAYWSYDGDTENKRVSKARRAYRAGAADLQKAGFRLLNYNSYYLYFVPSRKNCTGENRRYMVRDLKKNWDLRVWDSDRGRKLSCTDGVIGSAISVWGEDSAGVSAAKIYRQAAPLYRAMTRKL